MIDPVRASFDRIAEHYAADFADELTRKPWDVERLRRFAAACGRGPVLDIGCGAAGHVGRFLADLGPRVVGVDFSERSVAHARRLNPTLAFVAGDMQGLPVADRACAGIVAFYSLIYGDAASTSAALIELRRVLGVGGRLLVAVHAGRGAQRFTEYKGMAVDVELHYREPAAFAALVRAGRLCRGVGRGTTALCVRARHRATLRQRAGEIGGAHRLLASAKKTDSVILVRSEPCGGGPRAQPLRRRSAVASPVPEAAPEPESGTTPRGR